MTHLEAHTLLAHADGELTAEEELAVNTHLERCVECSSTLAMLTEAGALFADALHTRDAAEPAHWTAVRPTVPRPEAGRTVLSRESANVLITRAPRRAPHDQLITRAPRRAPPRYIRWAASIALLVATAASALVIRTALIDDDAPTIIDPAPVPPEPARAEAAVIVQPRDGVLRVVLSNVAAGSRVRVTSEDRDDAGIGVSGAATPHFTAEVGLVSVDAHGGVAQLHVTVPRTLRDAIVTWNGETLVTVRGGQVLPAHAATTGVVVDAVSTPRME